MIFKSFTFLSTTLLLLLLLLIPSTLSYDFQYEKDTNIIILSQLDFPQAIQQHPYLLVNFYARWCKYSKKLAPEYLKLSQTLKKDNPEVKIAKVEAYDEKALAQQYDIEGFPTLKIFVKGVPYEYHGDKTEAHTLEFIHRKQKKPLRIVSDIKTLDNLLKEYEWISVMIGSDNHAGVLDAASKLQDVLFVSTTSDAIKKKYGDLTNGEFVLVNNVTKGYKVCIEELNTENILSFIKNNRFAATIPRFGRGTAEHIMSSEEPAMILIKDSSQASKTAEEAFITASQDLSGRIFLTIADYQEEMVQLLAKSLGVNKEDLPAVRIIRADREKIRKYKLEGGITKSSLIKFQEDYADRKAPRVYLSEPIPKENNDLTKKVVLDTFKEEVLDSHKDVLVVFWAPWSSHCRAMMPTLDNVGRKTQDLEDFEVVKIDATANDVEKYGIDIVEYPTILLFTRGDKKNPIEFRGERNEYVFNDFIRAYATVNLKKLKKPDPWTLSEL